MQDLVRAHSSVIVKGEPSRRYDLCFISGSWFDAQQWALRPVWTPGSVHHRRQPAIHVVLYSGLRLPFPHSEYNKPHWSQLAVRSAQMFAFCHTKLILSQLYPSFVSQKALESYCFLLFACVCMVGCLYTFFVLPETKDKTLVEISNEFKAITLCGKSSEKKRVETKFWDTDCSVCVCLLGSITTAYPRGEMKTERKPDYT